MPDVDVGSLPAYGEDEMFEPETSAPFFQIDTARLFTIQDQASLLREFSCGEGFYWILTLSGSAYFVESQHSHFLTRGWVLVRKGNPAKLFRLEEMREPWRGLCLVSGNAFTSDGCKHVSDNFGPLGRIPLASPCIGLARKLAEKEHDPWTRSILAYRWFHAWWREAERHNQKTRQLLHSHTHAHATAQEVFSLKALSDQLGYSPSYLSRLLGKKWKTTPARVLRTARLEIAAQQLLASDVRVEALASQLGYLSDSAFIRAFRIHYGIPPEKYRLQNRG